MLCGGEMLADRHMSMLEGISGNHILLYWPGHLDQFKAECDTCDYVDSALHIYSVEHCYVRKIPDWEDGCLESGKNFYMPCGAEDSAPIPMTKVVYEYPLDIEQDHCYHNLPVHGFNPILYREPDRHRWDNGHPNTMRFTISIR